MQAQEVGFLKDRGQVAEHDIQVTGVALAYKRIIGDHPHLKGLGPSSQQRSDLSWGPRLRSYVDLSDSANLDLAGSYAWGNNDVGPGFKTELIGVDATFRWRPLRRAIYNRFLGRTEVVWSRREQEESTARAFGAYLSGEYQFARRWYGGVRLDYSERPDAPDLQDKGISALLTFWPSEFNQIRGQYRFTRYGEQETAHEVLFQLLFSIGAHGAHPF